MNKVINGKRYDTDKAERIGETANGTYPGDLDYYCETLYRKRTKEHFLHIEGGARSQVARRDISGWVGGSVIEPVSFDDAKKWAECNLDADEYEVAFGAASDEESPLYLKGVSAAAQAKLDREVSVTGKTKAQIVESLLEGL